MTNRFLSSARGLCAAIVPTLALLAAPADAAAQMWTHVAAACSVDEASMAKFDTNGARLRHKGTNTGKIYARCNVIDNRHSAYWNAMELVFKDNGTGERVIAQLYRVTNANGGITLIGTVDSDSYAGSANEQTQWEWLTSTTFDFSKYAYYVMLTVDRTGTATLPDAAIVRLYETVD